MCEKERKYHILLTLHLICSECSSSWWSGRGTDSFLLKALSFSKDTSMPFSHRSQFYASTRTVRIRAENPPPDTHTHTVTHTHQLQTFPICREVAVCSSCSHSNGIASSKMQNTQLQTNKDTHHKAEVRPHHLQMANLALKLSSSSSRKSDTA